MDVTPRCEGRNGREYSDDNDIGDNRIRNKEDKEKITPPGSKNGREFDASKPDDKNDDAHQDIWDQLNKSLDELTEEDVLALIFNSDEEAGLFYETYSRVVGFTVRKVDTKRDLNTNVVRYRRWVCSREGYGDRRHINNSDRKCAQKPIRRIGCPASFRIRYDRKSRKYVVGCFIKEHNHDLASPRDLPFLRTSKRARRVDEDVGFTAKDVQQALAKSDIQDSDTGHVLAHCALAYLCAKAEYDPGLYYKYDVNEEGQPSRLFWADSRSIADYAFFGDVLALNTKYRTNAYGKPFIVFAGFNNHHQTTIFGSALLGDETAETYVWLLETFLDAMDQKMPGSIITDCHNAIEEAIRRTFPTSQHRICSWHLRRDLVSNVNDASFLSFFNTLMEENCSPDEFELNWKKLVEKCGLSDHPWLAEAYSKRTKWAETYLREYFFAGIKSIQCKGMNVYFSRFLKVQLKLHEFMVYHDKALICLRDNEAKADTESEHAAPALSTVLRDLERHAADVFTRNTFYKFREQIMSDAMLILTCKEYVKDKGCWVYNFSEYTKPDKMWKVRFNPVDQNLSCSCFKLVTEGVPCCHMVSVMKNEHLREIPRSCIKKRWTKRARCELDSDQALNRARQMLNFGVLSSMCGEMNHYASQTMRGFKEVRDAICKLTSRMKQISNGGVDEPPKQGSHDAGTQFGVHDLQLAKTRRQCDSFPYRTLQPSDGGHCRCFSHSQSTPTWSHQSEGHQMHEDTRTTDGDQCSTPNENTSEMPNPHGHAIWEDNLKVPHQAYRFYQLWKD